MKVSLGAVAILLGSATMAFSADMPVKAPYVAPAAVWNWTGFYLGGHVGAGWGTTESTLTAFTPGGVIPGGFPIDQNSRSGFLGGGQIGYNYQFGWGVFGVQGDIAGMDVKGTTPCLVVFSCTGKSNWLGTVSGRLGGGVAERTLVYVKGGAAWMHTDHSLGIPAGFIGPAAATISSSSTAFGWLLGLGAEYAFDRNWSDFIEYDYMDFDTKNTVFDFTPLVGVPATANVDIKNKLSIAKIGINYKFGGPVVARY
jgi:outer membrane immunogenic protein